MEMKHAAARTASQAHDGGPTAGQQVVAGVGSMATTWGTDGPGW